MDLPWGRPGKFENAVPRPPGLAPRRKRLLERRRPARLGSGGTGRVETTASLCDRRVWRHWKRQAILRARRATASLASTAVPIKPRPARHRVRGGNARNETAPVASRHRAYVVCDRSGAGTRGSMLRSGWLLIDVPRGIGHCTALYSRCCATQDLETLSYTAQCRCRRALCMCHAAG